MSKVVKIKTSSLWLILLAVMMVGGVAGYFLWDIYQDLNQQIAALSPRTINKQISLNIPAGNKREIFMPYQQIELKQDTSFVALKDQFLTFNPQKGDLGDYTISLNGLDDHQNLIVYELLVKIELSQVNFDKLAADSLALLGDYADTSTVFVYDLKRKEGFDLEGDKVMPPASISKLPYALLVLRDIDQKKYTLADTITISSSYKAYDSDYLYSFANGSKVSLDQLLTYLIDKSDNTAMLHLENFLGGLDKVNNRTKTELGLEKISRNPHDTTANVVGEMLINIYKQKYLKTKTNDYLINLMVNTDSVFHDRIKKGVTEFPEAKVAHKIGNLWNNDGLVRNDAGIVCGKYTDFVIVVLARGLPDSYKGSEIISGVTNLVYKRLN